MTQDQPKTAIITHSTNVGCNSSCRKLTRVGRLQIVYEQNFRKGMATRWRERAQWLLASLCSPQSALASYLFLRNLCVTLPLHVALSRPSSRRTIVQTTGLLTLTHEQGPHTTSSNHSTTPSTSSPDASHIYSMHVAIAYALYCIQPG